MWRRVFARFFPWVWLSVIALFGSGIGMVSLEFGGFSTLNGYVQVMMALGVQRAVAVVGIVVVLAVGAAFGIERRANLAHLGAEALQHVDDHVVVADQDAVILDLRRQVAVAEMPRQPRKGRRIAPAHLD